MVRVHKISTEVALEELEEQLLKKLPLGVFPVDTVYKCAPAEYDRTAVSMALNMLIALGLVFKVHYLNYKLTYRGKIVAEHIRGGE